jgi:hypothetical protein
MLLATCGLFQLFGRLKVKRPSKGVQDCVQNVALTVKTMFRQQNSRNFPTTFWKLSLQLPDKGTLRKM